MSETTTIDETAVTDEALEALKAGKAAPKKPKTGAGDGKLNKELIKKAMAKAEAEGRDKMEAIKEVPPVAFTARIKPGVDLSDEASFLAPNVEISPTINPLFHALLCELGATPDGARTYRVSAGEKADPRKLEAIMEVLPGGICYAPAHVEKGEEVGFHYFNSRRYKVYGDLYWAFRATPAGKMMNSAATAHMRSMHPDEGPLAGAAIVISNNGKQLFIKVCTTRQENREGLYFTDDPNAPSLDLFRPGGKLEPREVTPDSAITILEEAAAAGYGIVDPRGDLKLMRSVLSEMVVAQRVPGAPGEARLVVGAKISTKSMKGVDGALPDPDPSRSTRGAIVPAKIAGAAVADAAAGGAVATILDPMVQDVITMAEAEPFSVVTAPGLEPRHYQEECIGLHLATNKGFLNACSPGLGKTATSLWGMQAWADRKREARDAS